MRDRLSDSQMSFDCLSRRSPAFSSSSISKRAVVLKSPAYSLVHRVLALGIDTERRVSVIPRPCSTDQDGAWTSVACV